MRIHFLDKHPAIAQFITFFLISNGVTVLQMLLMPLLKSVFDTTGLLHMDFQVLRLGTVDGRAYYLFDYKSGAIAQGGAAEDWRISWPWSLPYWRHRSSISCCREGSPSDPTKISGTLLSGTP